MHIFYSFIFQVLSQAAGLDWNKKKTSNSNEEAGKTNDWKQKFWLLKSKHSCQTRGCKTVGDWLLWFVKMLKKLRVQQSRWNISGSKTKTKWWRLWFNVYKTKQKFQNFFSSEVEKIVKFWVQWSSKIQKQNITFWSKNPLAARAQSVDSGRFVRTRGKGFHPKG